MVKKYFNLMLVALLAGAALGYNALHTTPQTAAAPPASAPGVPRGSAAAPGAALPLRQVETKDVDVMLVIDNSGSMSGGTCSKPQPAAGNDPSRNRIKAAEIVIASLAADIQPRETKLGIVTFGNRAELIAELTQLSNEDTTVRSTLAQRIQNLPCAGDTNIVEAITVARQELKSERHRPGNTPVIIFLTDGKPTEGGGEAEIRRLIGELGDVLFFAVLLGDASDFRPFKDFWRDMAAGNPGLTVNELQRSEDMPALYQQIKARIIDTDHYQAPPLAPGAAVDLRLPANLEQAVITVLKPASQVAVTLARPDGQDAALLPADRFKRLDSNTSIEVFILQRPDSGVWRVASANGEILTVLRPEMKSVYQIQLVAPDQQGALGVDEPSDLAVRVVDSGSKQPIQATFSFSATYRPRGGGTAVAFPLTATAGPDYAHQFPPQTFADGETYLI
ncbi:MAG TPA: vWA domain-containing protein, partial [Herpetosiphonaceae bacterium]